LKLDSKAYDLLTSPDRDWSATIQFTALGPSYKCEPCKIVDPIFKAVAKAWTKVAPKERNQHFFGSLDFSDGADVFKQLGLVSAPIIKTFPPVKGDRASQRTGPINYDFPEGFDAAALADHLNRHTPKPIPYKPPTDWTPIIGIAVAVIITAVGAPFVLPLLTNKWLWALISIGVSLIMISGFMFVRIRGNPYVAAGPGGQAQWIAGGFQNQFGMETQVVAFIYGLLSFSCLSLILFVPRIPSKMRQGLAIYIWSGVATLVFSVLIAFFRLKNPGYPYRLFL